VLTNCAIVVTPSGISLSTKGGKKMAYILYDKNFCAHMIVASAQDTLDIVFWDINAEWKITRPSGWQCRDRVILTFKKTNSSEDEWYYSTCGSVRVSSNLEDVMHNIIRKSLKITRECDAFIRRFFACPVEEFESKLIEYKRDMIRQMKERNIHPEVKMNFVSYKKEYPLEWKVLFRYNGALPEMFVKKHPELATCTIQEYQKIITTCLANPNPIQKSQSLFDQVCG